MLGTLIETILLLINAIAILNEKRFLKKYGFHTEAAQGTNQNEVLTSKSQAIMMIFTLRSVGRCNKQSTQMSQYRSISWLSSSKYWADDLCNVQTYNSITSFIPLFCSHFIEDSLASIPQFH